MTDEVALSPLYFLSPLKFFGSPYYFLSITA